MESASNASNTLLARPSTAAVLKMLHKFVFANTQEPAQKNYTAMDLQRLIDRTSRAQRKTLGHLQALVKALSVWGADLPGADARAMMVDFAELLESVNSAVSTQSECLNALKVLLGAISKRELRQQSLLERHEKLQKALADLSLKHGPGSEKSTLVMDELEENEYNIRLVEQQLTRTATLCLKEGLTLYFHWSQVAISSLLVSAARLADTLSRVDPPAHKIILRDPEPATGNTGPAMTASLMFHNAAATPGAPVNSVNTAPGIRSAPAAALLNAFAANESNSSAQQNSGFSGTTSETAVNTGDAGDSLQQYPQFRGEVLNPNVSSAYLTAPKPRPVQFFGSNENGWATSPP